MREVTFAESSLRIGGFKAFDFWGDGSFYLLDSPGHAITPPLTYVDLAALQVGFDGELFA